MESEWIYIETYDNLPEPRKGDLWTDKVMFKDCDDNVYEGRYNYAFDCWFSKGCLIDDVLVDYWRPITKQDRMAAKGNKKEMFAPKPYALYENGVLVSIYDSHKAAKKARYFNQKEADADMLDVEYEIKPYKS